MGRNTDNQSLYEQSDRREEEISTDKDQRLQEDRRGNFVNLISPDEEFYNEMINWLIENGDDQWSVGSNDNEAADSEVTCRVRFDSPEKLAAFKNWLDDKSNTP